MTSEVIIVSRGEIPSNLTRTVAQAVEQTNVCVVFDGSEKGNETPRGLDKSVRVERPWDGQAPRGPGQARHHGITTSKADVIILSDGHIKFGDGWHEQILAHLRTNPQHITCMRTYSLTQKWDRIHEPMHTGAFLALKTTEPQVEMYGPRREYFGVTAKWAQDDIQSGVIQAPMGAVYGMTRKWYRAIGQPFSILDAWGGDEELMAICGWLCGGQTYLLDCPCGHVHAAIWNGRQIHHGGRWANRVAVLRVLPTEERAEMEAWIRQTQLPWGVIDGLYNEHERPDKVEKLRKHLAKQRRTWKGLVKKLTREWTMPETKPLPTPVKAKKKRRIPPAPKDDVTQVVVRKVEQCDRCGRLNSFRQVAGIRAMAGGGLCWCRCSHCGHKAQVRVVS
jgi:hypothetical protein